MTPTRCDECGASYTERDDSCQARFDQLLALDHSRQEPWGSRHGLAFAVFALQHPRRYGAGSVARSLELIQRVVRDGEPLASVVADFRARTDTEVPAPIDASPRTFAVTIADLGDFDAASYAHDLQRWARAALDAHSRAHAKGILSRPRPVQSGTP
ncbi:MAG TPA: DUF5946 family protein [Gemmatimonadaceae bacterium]|nr:DUF5946 family protein [Gemmatimonadaceae bacterium]